VRFLYRDSRQVDGGSVQVGFTDALPLIDTVVEARRTVLAEVAQATASTPVVMHQVHGAEVHLVDDGPVDDAPPQVDALVTARRDVALMTRAADCVPVLLVSAEGLTGAVHAGRRGVALAVVTAAVDRLHDLGASDVTAWVGPHICGGCYEVPAEMQEEVAALVPATRATTTWGTSALDLGAGVRHQLEVAGCRVVEVGRCTREDDELPSYRREGAAAGRLAGVVWSTP
jgi:YfiH family protein